MASYMPIRQDLLLRLILRYGLFLILLTFPIPAYTEMHKTYSDLYIVIAYDQPSEPAIKENLKKNFPAQEKFFNEHRVVRIIIHGSDDFCANEFIVTNGSKSIEAVLLIFTAQNEWIATYCHKVLGFTWGYIFIPIENGNNELGFVYKNKYGKIEIAREVQI